MSHGSIPYYIPKGGEYNIPTLQLKSLRSEWLSYVPKTTDLVGRQLDLNIDLFDSKSHLSTSPRHLEFLKSSENFNDS